MIRMANSFGRSLLWGLRSLQQAAPAQFKELIRQSPERTILAAYEAGNIPRAEFSTYLGASGNVEVESFGDLLNVVAGQLPKSSHEETYDLLEQLIMICRRGQGRVIDVRTMEMLRRVLLSGKGYKDLITKLAEEQLVCAGCARVFDKTRRETMTLYISGDGSGAVSFYCVSCLRPHMIKCASPGCTELVNIPQEFKIASDNMPHCAKCAKPEKKTPSKVKSRYGAEEQLMMMNYLQGGRNIVFEHVPPAEQPPAPEPDEDL